MPLQVVMGSLVLALGTWMLFKSLAFRARRMALLRNCVRTVGRVVRLEDTTSDGDFQITYAPVARYTAAGRTHALRLPPRNDVSNVPVGARVPVFYQRGDPTNAVHAPHTWDANLFIAASLLTMLIGVMFYFAEVRPAHP